MRPAAVRNFAAEFVGTVIVMLGGPGLIVLGREVNRLEFAIGFGLATAISIGVIGAVANPMFSFALWFARGISGRSRLMTGSFTDSRSPSLNTTLFKLRPWRCRRPS